MIALSLYSNSTSFFYCHSVAIIGIIDLDAYKIFPHHDERMADCRDVPPQREGLDLLHKYRKNFVNDGSDVLVADVTALKAELELDLSKFRDWREDVGRDPSITVRAFSSSEFV